MRERIELTIGEQQDAIEALRAWDYGNDNHEQGVLAVIAAVNRARTGDPVGTVRRDPDTGMVAVRVAKYDCALLDCGGVYEAPTWQWVDEDGKSRHARGDTSSSAREIASWPIVFSPGVEP